MRRVSFLFAALTASLLMGRPCGAEDLSNRFGIAGNIAGFVPMGPDYVTDTADSIGLGLGGTFSFEVGSHIGMGVSFDRLTLGEGMNLTMTNVLFRGRLYADRRWTPTLEFGPGSAQGVNSNRIENVSFKAAIGLEYFATPHWAFSPQIGYAFISHSGGDATTYAHLTFFGLRTAYYFGRG